jgi:type IV pilus assembly protein PilE
MKRIRGFTLIELMMAIAILAVLAAVATTSYIRYMRKARTQEAVGMLGDIRIRQEIYFQTNSRYACSEGGTAPGNACSCGMGAFFPNSPDPADSGSYDILPVAMPVLYCNGATPGTAQAAWCDLGLNPNGEFWFRYAFQGWDGQAGSSPNDCAGVNTCADAAGVNCFQLDINRPWWFAVAHGNLDGDPHNVLSTFYISSATKQVLMVDEME